MRYRILKNNQGIIFSITNLITELFWIEDDYEAIKNTKVNLDTLQVGDELNISSLEFLKVTKINREKKIIVADFRYLFG